VNPNLERAILLFQQSRHDMAADELRQSLAIEPRDPYAHALLALCLAQQQQFKEATGEAQQAIHLGPDDPFSYYALAKIWYERNYDKEALSAIHEALRLDSSQTSYYALLAQIHLREARWRDALDAAERGLQLDAEDVDCTNLRAIALVKLGRKSEAGTTIDAALRRNPDNAITHANQGWTLLEKNQPKQALEHFREALRLDPQNEWARRGIIEALKARNIIYALMLRYFLFMAKFSKRGQWAILLGAYFGNQLLRGLSAAEPAWEPWILPIRILYMVFALMTWIASPLFNLTLRLSRFGRMLLSREQIIASNCIGLVLLLALLSLAACFKYGFNSPWLIGALMFGLLLLPVAGTFNTPAGGTRRLMTVLTGLTAASGVGGFVLLVLTDHRDDNDPYRRMGALLLMASLLGAVGSSWIVNIALTQRRRR
jgi:tetratricopeptide (TPR) repeat protein